MKTPRIIQLTLCGPGYLAKEIELAKEAIEECQVQNFDHLNCDIKETEDLFGDNRFSFLICSAALMVALCTN